MYDFNTNKTTIFVPDSLHSANNILDFWFFDKKNQYIGVIYDHLFEIFAIVPGNPQ
jgi:hypothetical protein